MWADVNVLVRELDLNPQLSLPLKLRQAAEALLGKPLEAGPLIGAAQRLKETHLAPLKQKMERVGRELDLPKPYPSLAKQVAAANKVLGLEAQALTLRQQVERLASTLGDPK